MGVVRFVFIGRKKPNSYYPIFNASVEGVIVRILFEFLSTEISAYLGDRPIVKLTAIKVIRLPDRAMSPAPSNFFSVPVT